MTGNKILSDLKAGETVNVLDANGCFIRASTRGSIYGHFVVKAFVQIENRSKILRFLDQAEEVVINYANVEAHFFDPMDAVKFIEFLQGNKL